MHLAVLPTPEEVICLGWENERMTEHCCEAMTRHVDWHCDTHADPFACPDALVDFSAKFREYGLIVHDGGA
ncbi:hypothetical protein AB0H73_37570 [Streptomyces olivoreticuli]